MTTVALGPFMGMIPRLAPQRLPVTGSDLAINCDLLSGNLRALRSTRQVHAFSEGFQPRAAFRIPEALQGGVGAPPVTEFSGNDVWLAFEQEFTHFLKGPLVNDAFDRWYWTEEGEPPRYNTLARIQNGDPPYRLGVPRPVDIPSVTPSGGTTSLQVTRCYTYTFISAYGEEGPPVDPTCAEGNDDGTWTIGNLSTTVPAPYDTEGNITKKRIYRTVTGFGGADAGSFFFVAEVDIAQASYVDTIPTDEVSLNLQLQSDTWVPPPDDLIGLVRHPNGFFVGFSSGTNLYFSEPFRPHAWPVEYILSTEGDIQALGVFGGSIAVTTNAHPYAASGTTPSAMRLSKNDSSKPCLSRFGVVSSEAGVIYPSPDGLSLIGPAGLTLLTENLVSREQWNTRYEPQSLRAARFGFQYLGLILSITGNSRGFIYSPQEATALFSEVETFAQANAASIHTDLYSGQILLIRGQNVELWADYNAFPEQYQWTSMEFVTPKPVNFGAYRIDFDPFTSYPGGDPSPNLDPAPFIEWNGYRFAAGVLNPMASAPMGGRVQVTLDPGAPDLESYKNPMGGSALYAISRFVSSFVTVELWGDRELKYSNTLEAPGRYRLPIGYKTDIWQLKLSGNADIHHFKMAETGRELERV